LYKLKTGTMLHAQAHQTVKGRKDSANVLKECVTVTEKARPVLFCQDEIHPYSASLNECAPHCAILRSNRPIVEVLVRKVRVKAFCKRRYYHPLQPGKTAKRNQRQFVVHDYHDHSQDENDTSLNVGSYAPTGTLFPLKLHEILDEVAKDGRGHIISWAPHGRCFTLHMPKEFVDQVLPR
jgi:HSF-type DNA-binding